MAGAKMNGERHADRSRSPPAQAQNGSKHKGQIASIALQALNGTKHNGQITSVAMQEKHGLTADELALLDGHSVQEVFEDPRASGHTYDDFVCLPGHIGVGIHDISLETQVTRSIKLKRPILSSPMDTVTESRMAIAMALQGGLGVIHRNLSIEAQCQEVMRVKKYKSGFITDPICVKPTMLVSELNELRRQCGFSGFPVTMDGKLCSELLGLVTKRDTDLVENPDSVRINKVMTDRKDLVVAQDGIDLPAAYGILQKIKKGKLPVVMESGRLIALTSLADLHKHMDFPHASKDDKGGLLVAAAVGMDDQEKDRVRALACAGVNVLVIDSRQGDNVMQHHMVRWIKQEFPRLQVIAGNVVTTNQAARLIDSGADALRVGMGAASISTRQQVGACGRGQASAVYHVARFAKEHGVPVIADGGIRGSGAIVKALCLGAAAVMCGRMFAGTDATPGEYFYSQSGERLKRYRGMNSLDAMQSDSYSAGITVKVAQGVNGTVEEKGSIHKYIQFQAKGLEMHLQDLGVKSVAELHQNLSSGRLRIELRSIAAQMNDATGPAGIHRVERKPFM